jgi:CheY-like chemotaxis protein
MLRPAFAQKGLKITIQIDPDLPELLIDATRIRQVLLNLVNNALRFTEKGGVSLSAALKEGQVLVSVDDTGTGIALDEQSKVFSEFRQVGQDSWRRREGSGLGLAISRRFVELHGGKIWFESEPGKGSTFYFTLPVSDLPAQALLSPVEEPAPQVHLRQRPAVLVFSGNPLAPGMLQQCLNSYLVVPLDKEEDFSRLVEQHFPRALLVDRSTRDALCLPLQDLPYDLPVVNLSLPGVQDLEDDLPPGVFAYITKPVSRETLEKAVRSLDPGVRKLLVVDDDPAMLRFVTQALKNRQDGEPVEPAYTFLTAETGEQAVQILYEQEVDAVLLDLDLPDINGWQVLERAQKEDQLASRPVLIISALDKPQVLLSRGQDVIELRLKRTLSQQELAPVLQSIIETVQPFYTRPPSNPPPRLREKENI